MRAFHFMGPSILAVAVFAMPSTAFAQPQQPNDVAAVRQQIDQLRQDFDTLKQQLAVLEGRLAAIPGQAPAVPVVPPAPLTDPALAQPTGQTPAAASNVFNPSTTVIGNFIGAGGRNTFNPAPALQMQESEVSFQAVVDPYARADFFVAFGDEGAELEEGFITFPTLPGGLLMRVGKMKAAFGKANTLHAHVLPWADRPLVLDHLAGGEEGISDAGISVARLIPNPWVFLEATGQVFRGDSGDVFESSTRGHVSYVGHLRGYQDITESSNVDLGFSYARGHNGSGRAGDIDLGDFTTSLYAVDATFRWKPLRRSIYRSFLGRAEIIWSRRDDPGGPQKAMGYYVSGDYQLGRRWFAGARLDRSDHSANVSLFDTGQSLLLTYKPSEYSLVRGQYRRTKYAIGETGNEVLFQFLFAIGAHGAHPF